MCAKSGMLPGVRHDEGLARLHGMLAERVRQRVLPRGRERLGQPALTLEEMPIAVHQRNERHRHAEDDRRQTCQPVECLLGRGIEERRPPQRFEASLVLYDIDELVVQVEALAQTALRSLANAHEVRRRQGRPEEVAGDARGPNTRRIAVAGPPVN